MHPEYQKFNPFRTPNWRLDRVLQLVDNRPRPLPVSRRRDDRYIVEYRRFLLKWRSRTGDEERLDMFPENPGMFMAHFIYYHPDKEWRAMVDACLLAGMTDHEIGEHVGTLPEAIDAYEALFFNVRDRLTNQVWIVKTILGAFSARQANANGTIDEGQYYMLLKLFGYYGGPDVLMTLLSGCQERGRPHSLKDVANWFDETLSANIRRHAVLASRSLQTNKFNAVQIMELHTKLIEIARVQEANAGSTNADEKNIAATLTAIPWMAGPAAAKKLPSPLQQFSETAAELRADEMLLLNAGMSAETTEGMEKLAITVKAEE